MISRLLQRSDIIDYQTYEDERDAYRRSVLEIKKPRRIHLGEHLTFLFENRETLRYQVQEIMRAERIARESAIEEEIEVYNAMLGEPGELGCALLIEIADKDQRPELLAKWLGLEKSLYAVLDDGTKVRPTFDPSQVGEDRLSAVQYLRFPVDGQTPTALGCDFPEMTLEVELTDDQRAALTEDLARP